jgi:hypothetical protein
MQRLNVLSNEFDQRETLREMTETSGTGDASGDRIAALEKKVQDMEAMVEAIIQDLLDFRAIAMILSKQTEENNRPEIKRWPIVPDTASPTLAGPSIATPSENNTVIRPKSTHQPDIPVAPAEPAMARIMQSDGTMKLEIRRGDKNSLVASAGNGGNKKGTPVQGKQDPLIYAVDSDKTNLSDSADK